MTKKTYCKWFLSLITDMRKVPFYPIDPLVEISLAITEEIGQGEFRASGVYVHLEFSFLE